jgi:hypothetical protein
LYSLPIAKTDVANEQYLHHYLVMTLNIQSSYLTEVNWLSQWR